MYIVYEDFVYTSKRACSMLSYKDQLVNASRDIMAIFAMNLRTISRHCVG